MTCDASSIYERQWKYCSLVKAAIASLAFGMELNAIKSLFVSQFLSSPWVLLVLLFFCQQHSYIYYTVRRTIRRTACGTTPCGTACSSCSTVRRTINAIDTFGQRGTVPIDTFCGNVSSRSRTFCRRTCRRTGCSRYRGTVVDTFCFLST